MSTSACPDADGEAAALSALVDHRSHHEDALMALSPPAFTSRCHAVAVPTSRGPGARASGLTRAAIIALAHKCPLVVLISGPAATPLGQRHIESVVSEATDGQVSPVLVNLERVPRLALELASDRSRLATESWRSWRGLGDTALKRNAAILLAAREKWTRLLFLDDDIVGGDRWSLPGQIGLDPEGVGLVMRALEEGSHRAVGWAATEHDDAGYADNSLVCRIRRHVGFDQGVFVGGGALAISVDERTPFFPRIYNEDWLFCLRLLLWDGKGAVALAGGISQDPPESIFNVDRALMEELGDILAEALMNVILHHPENVDAAVLQPFWNTAIARRRQLVHDLIPLLQEGVWRGQFRDEIDSARTALEATITLHERMAENVDRWSTALREFISAWIADAATWSKLLVDAENGSVPPSLAHALPRHEVLMPPGS